MSGALAGSYVIRLLTRSKQEAFRFPAATEATVGRGTNADVEVPFVELSRRHACFRFDPSFAVRDLGSTNGTFVRGARLAPDVFVPIELSEPIMLADIIALVLPSSHTHLVQPLIGADVWGERVERAFGAAEARGDTFTVCEIVLTKPSDRLIALVALAVEGDTAAFLSDTHLALLLVGRSRDSSLGLKPAIDKYLTLAGARGRVTVSHCPTDVTTAEAFLHGREPSGVSRAPTIRPSHAIVRGERMTKLYELVREVAPTSTSIVVLGETGAGKEVIAQAIHAESERRDAAFVALNCAALPETLLESELFGYERGAFTGAVNAKAGLFETANGGTVFLDEIAEMPLPTQATLLRVLQDRTVLRVGALKPKPIDFRLISATNRNLEQEIACGRFRADLYYRINGFSLLIPPLRERQDEIGPLASMFAEAAARALGRRVPMMAPDTLRLLLEYRWPGNVRELKTVVERAVLLCRSGPLLPEHLSDELRRAAPSREPAVEQRRRSSPPPERASGSGADPPTRPDPSFPEEATIAQARRPIPKIGDDADDAPRVFTLPEELERIERDRILAALTECGGNQSRAARMLGMSRRVLIGRLVRYKVRRPRK
jgi:transcriptional regulator with PAS, ATPase and Fis domain